MLMTTTRFTDAHTYLDLVGQEAHPISPHAGTTYHTFNDAKCQQQDSFSITNRWVSAKASSQGWHILAAQLPSNRCSSCRKRQLQSHSRLEIRGTLTFDDIAKLQRQVKAQNNTPASVETERDQMPNIHKRARLSPGASRVKRDNGMDVHDLTSDELPHKGKVVIVID
jgi:hypothetical protein